MSGIRHCRVSPAKTGIPRRRWQRDRFALPPAPAGLVMAEPILEYRIWQRGAEWHWQVMSKLKDVLASGIANSSAAARIDALNYCHECQGNHTEPD